VVLSIYFMADGLGISVLEAFERVKESSSSQIVVWEDLLGDRNRFWKHIVGGAFVTTALTGLDQDLIQKNLSMNTIGEAQKNMLTCTGVFVVIILFFLAVGALLYIYVAEKGIDISMLRTPDYLYPEIALNHLSIAAGVIFMMGLTAATFATTDSAITALDRKSVGEGK